MNLYLRSSLSARSHRRRHFSRLPPFPGMNSPVEVSYVSSLLSGALYEQISQQRDAHGYYIKARPNYSMTPHLGKSIHSGWPNSLPMKLR